MEVVVDVLDYVRSGNSTPKCGGGWDSKRSGTDDSQVIDYIEFRRRQ